MSGHAPVAKRTIVNAVATAAVLIVVIWWLSAHDFSEVRAPKDRSVAEWIEFWINRYQTIIGVLAATAVGWMAYDATRQSIASNEAIAGRQIAFQQRDIRAAWDDVKGLVIANIEGARGDIVALKAERQQNNNWMTWREKYIDTIGSLDFLERAEEVSILLPHLPPRNRIIALRAAMAFREVGAVLGRRLEYVRNTAAAPSDRDWSDLLNVLDAARDKLDHLVINNLGMADEDS
ncbi:hypothetical protein ACETRX_03985 [Labrys portucalensis]|uniref:Uncharacterized protein n=1 Tax=Labrys neptuniae TaxID=376174 RepID=A0ABV6Z9C3_9HYPH